VYKPTGDKDRPRHVQEREIAHAARPATLRQADREQLIEKGVLDVKSMVTATYPLERAMEAVQAVADRTTLGAVVTF